MNLQQIKIYLQHKNAGSNVLPEEIVVTHKINNVSIYKENIDTVNLEKQFFLSPATVILYHSQLGTALCNFPRPLLCVVLKFLKTFKWLSQIVRKFSASEFACISCH